VIAARTTGFVASLFVMLGFLEPVVARIPLPEAQDRLRALLDAQMGAGRHRRRGRLSW